MFFYIMSKKREEPPLTEVDRLVDRLVELKIQFRKEWYAFVLGYKQKTARTALNRKEPAGQPRGYS